MELKLLWFQSSPFSQKRISLFFATGTALLLLLLQPIIAVAQTPAAKISLSLKQAPLEQAFKEIQKQSGYRFIYTRQQLDHTQPVTLQLQDASLEGALSACFKDQPLQYIIEGTYIAVKDKAPASAPPQPSFNLTGVVTNENGAPLWGATIWVKGTNQSVATTANGRFHLRNVSERDVIEVTNVGYLPQTLTLENQRHLQITLEREITSLEETLVIAYGTTTRRLNTGTVSKVTAKEISRQPVSNPIAALQGRVPGLFITQQNGLPGSNFSVLIRGRNSIQNGTSPFFIIDGVPFLNDADRLTQRGGTLNANNPFNSINPLDIESIEILKDADATAIYGSRGANGVILITTKKGRPGKTELVASFQTGWGRVAHTMDYMDTETYLQMRREAFVNDNVTPTQANAYDLLAWDTSRYTDWKKKLIGGTSRTNNAALRLSGGTAQTNFSLSSQYYRETTVFPSDHAIQRSSVAFDMRHHSLDQKFQTSFTATYSHQKSTLPQTDLTAFITLAPNAPSLYDSLGRLNWSENNRRFNNPLASLLQQHTSGMDRLTTNLHLSYTLIKNLTLKSSLGYNSIFFDETTLKPIASFDPATNTKGSASFGNNKVGTWILEPQLEYAASFLQKGLVNILFGLTAQETINKSNLVEGSGYGDDQLLNSTTGAASLLARNQYSQYRYTAGYGRFNVRWDNKYLLNLTARRDGSSRFGTDRRFSNFAAIGGGWIFSEASFIKKALPFISYGKLRASYGITGNDQIGDYQYLDVYAGTSYNYQGLASLRPIQLFNADYSWERNKKAEAALELGFWNNRLLLNINWFRSISDNQLLFYSLPTQTGFAGITQNFPGAVQNKGYEIELNGTILRSSAWQWNSGLNVTFARNKLLSFPGLEHSAYASTYAIGQPLNVLFGYQFLGVHPATGVYQFEDKNRDGLLTPQSGNQLNDFGIIGTTNPDYYGGLQNEMTYKGISLSFLIQFVKQTGRHPIYANSALYGAVNTNHPLALIQRWRQPGEATPYQKYSQRTTSNPAATALRQLTTSSAVLTDASFARLKNVQVQFQLPPAWLSKAKIRESRIYLQAQNLFTLTAFEGTDPETGSRQSLPPLRLLAAGIEFKF